jgi:hypothetical protein
MTINNKKLSHQRIRPNYVHMGVATVLVLALFCVHNWFLNFDDATVASIVFFNLLFLLLVFPLEGTFFRKMVLLIGGNHVGVLWYLVQLSFAETFLFLSTGTKLISLVAKPLIDFVWIVVVWSFSLSVLVSSKTKSEKLKQS